MNRENRRGFALSGALFAVIALGLSDTAWGQPSITVTPQTLNFTAPANVVASGCNGANDCKIHVTGNNVGTVGVQVAGNSSWIHVTPIGLNLPGDLSVSIDTSSLPAGGSTGSFVVYSSSNFSVQTTVTVNATVSGSSQLSTTPTSITFNAQSGANFGTPQGCPIQNGPASCQVTVISSGPQLTYNITPSTKDGNPWLIVDALSGRTNGTPLNVAVNPSAVPSPGTYQGSILFQSTSTSDSTSVSVTMVVSATPTITVTPLQLNFFYTVGGTLPPQQQITVTASAGSVPFNVTTSAGSSSWLGVNPLNSTATANTPAVLNVSVSPSSLPTGRQSAQITINPTGGGAAQTVTVVFVISTNPFLTLSNTQLTFSAPFGGSVPQTQAVTVGSTGAALGFNVATTSDQNWLSVGANSGVTGTQTGAIVAGVNPTVLPNLGVGTYNGTITVTPANGDPYSLTITATLTVGATSQITGAPQSLYFSFQLGQAAPAAQTVTLATLGPSVGFSVSTALNGSNPAGCGTASWLVATPQQSPLTTPNLLTVSVNTAGMTAATCLGTVKVTYAGLSGNAELDIPVTLFVASTALLNVGVPQSFGVESTTLGGNNITRQISLTSTDGTTAIQYQVGFQSSPCAWLFAAPISGGSNGTTPTPVQVNILPACLGNPGTYQGSVTITSSNLPQPVTLPITLFVNSNVQVSVTPQALTFQQAQNGPLPDPQKLNFTVSGGNAPFIATASTDIGNWLKVDPGSGNTSSGFVTVSILANSLPPSSTPYNGRVTLTFQNAATPSAVIPVRYTVNPPQSLTVSPNTPLTFGFQIGGSAPPPQQLNVSSTGGAVNFTVGTTSTGGWLGADTSSSTTPANGNPKTVNITVDPTKIPAGTQAGAALQGAVTISAPGVLANPIILNVTLNITAAPVPQPSVILNSASISAAAISPGELIAIKGASLGPASPAGGTTFTVNANGTVSTTLAGVGVTFNGIAGIPTFVSATQINVIVPWEIATFSSVQMVISFNGGQSAPLSLNVSAVSPAIYTQNATGSGQAAAVNLSPTAATPYNGPAGTNYPGTSQPLAPAPQGSFVSFFLAGCGQTSPASTTGTVNPANQLLPLRGWTPGSNIVTATIGGQPAVVQFAGAAPTLLSGVCQVNLQVPTGVTGNNVAVSITIDGVQTLGAATMAVQ